MPNDKRLEAAQEWAYAETIRRVNAGADIVTARDGALLEYVVELEERLERDLYPYDRNHKEAE